MSHEDLEEKLDRLPRVPGVYLFRDLKRVVVYVGKAKNLRSRVRSYFRGAGDQRLVERFIEKYVFDFEVLVTRNEKEAFLLENNLIKKLKPRFNIRLRDDKNFLHLKIDRSHPFPAIVPVRRPRRDDATYFGPYASAGAIRSTLRLIRSFLSLRDCSDRELEARSRPCLKYQIKMCSAPCVGKIDQAAYRVMLDQAIEILRGRTGDLVDRIRNEMQRASTDLEFERAALLRDQLTFLETSTAGQLVEGRALFDLDAIGFHRSDSILEVVVLFFRDGKLVSAAPYSFESELPLDEALSEFLWQYYGSGRSIPEEILVPRGVYGLAELALVLQEKRGSRVSLHAPQRGPKLRLLEMAQENARLSFEVGRDRRAVIERVHSDLALHIGMTQVPKTIECCDISTTFGTSSVGSIIRFEDGEPDKTRYRKYRIRSVVGSDDYGSMREVLTRRLRRGLTTGDLPDLLIVDGGRGQLGVALEVIGELGVEGLAVAALAKGKRRGRGLILAPGEEERLFVSGREEPVRLAQDCEVCYLLQRLRDESHRFAVEYHRKKRQEASLAPALAGVAGLGETRRSRLLGFFGGLRGLAAASVEEISRVPGIGPKLASRVHDTVHGRAD